MLSHQDVSRWYPDGVRGFEGEVGAVIPRYVGNKKREWRIGETTDDTERTVAVARAIIAEKGVSHLGIGREMLGCVKSVHPGLRSLWEFYEAADSARTTSAHDGCGAAIRVSPVGILYPSHALRDLVTGAREASISTHGGSLAIAAAAATAAAVSTAVDGGNASQVAVSAQQASALAGAGMAGHFAGVFHDRASCGSRPSCRLAHTHTGGHCGVLFSEQPPHDRAACPSSGHHHAVGPRGDPPGHKRWW